jgi:acyl-CoA thioester hydrolase
MNAIFVHRLDVRFRDCDPMGHVNNAVYLTYLEQARFAYWRDRLPGETPGVILARAEIDFKLPARYGDVLDIRMSLERIGRTSFTYAYEIVDQLGRLVASARTVQVIYDYAAAKPVPISEDLKGRLGPPAGP